MRNESSTEPRVACHVVAHRSRQISQSNRPGLKLTLQRVREFSKDDSGSEILEWILVAFVLLMATGYVLHQITGEVVRIFEDILRELAR